MPVSPIALLVLSALFSLGFSSAQVLAESGQALAEKSQVLAKQDEHLGANELELSEGWSEQEPHQFESSSASKANQWLRTRTSFSDGIVSFEFKIPKNGKGEVLILGSYGIALYDSYGSDTLDLSTMGALQKSWGKWEWSEYDRYDDSRSSGGQAPLLNPAIAPGQWQRFEARYRGPRFDNALNRVEQGVIFEVKINDQLVHENLLLGAPTQNAINFWEESTGPLTFEGRLGEFAVRNIVAERANYAGVKPPEQTGGSTKRAKLKNQVSDGRDAFLGKGCGECHSLKANDSAVKTGPNLYGLFQLSPQAIQVEDPEKHRFDVKANFDYLKTSIRSPLAHLALTKSGEQAGSAYLPIMPSYTKEVLSDGEMDAVYSYLLTKNTHANRGPVEVLLGSEGLAQYNPMKDAQEFLVIDRVRVQRGPMKGMSARAAHVGPPNRIHNSFDPRNFSVSKLWQGGFLQAEGELNNRGGKGYAMGYSHIEVPLGDQGQLIQILNTESEPVDFSFKEPVMGDLEPFKKALASKRSQRDLIKEQDARFLGYTLDSTKPTTGPEFHLQIGASRINASLSFEPSGRFTATLSGKRTTQLALAINTEILSDLAVDGGSMSDDQKKWNLPPGEKTLRLSGSIVTIAPSSWKPEVIDFAFSAQALTTESAEISAPAGYQAESLYPPLDNAGRKQLFEALGIASAANGNVVLSTRTAGVWHLRDGRWYPFADGIFDSLGVVIEDEKGYDVVVGSKLELTRISDTNGDGIADKYLTLFDAHSHADYHSYLHGPTKDAEGNYVIAINLGTSGLFHGHPAAMMSTHGGYPGWAIKVSPNGDYELFASGLRSPASLGTDPQGGLWYADNQGDFVGTSKFFRVKQNAFYGHPASLIDLHGIGADSKAITWENVQNRKERAPILLPQNRLANSPGNPTWDTTKGRFGPFQGQLIFGDQTQSNLVRVVTEVVDGQEQGVAIPFIEGLASGVMRPVFTKDGALLVGQTGRGWQAKGGKVAALQRITWNQSADMQAIQTVSASERGFRLLLTAPLAEDISELGKDIAIESWVYRDAPEYGSEELGLREESIAGLFRISEKEIEIRLTNLDQPDVHPQQTARVYQITLPGTVFKKPRSQTQPLKAFYTLHSFKNNNN